MLRLIRKNTVATVADLALRLGSRADNAGETRMNERREREARELLAGLKGTKSDEARLELVRGFAEAARADEARILTRFMGAHPERGLSGGDVWQGAHYGDDTVLR